jgi:hypothetical protein
MEAPKRRDVEICVQKRLETGKFLPERAVSGRHLPAVWEK